MLCEGSKFLIRIDVCAEIFHNDTEDAYQLLSWTYFLEHGFGWERHSLALPPPSSFISKEGRALGHIYPITLPRLRVSPLLSGWLMVILFLLRAVRILIFPDREALLLTG